MSDEFKHVYEAATIALNYVKNLVDRYLKNRKYGESYDELIKTYELRDLLIKPVAEIPDSIQNEVHRKMYALCFNLKLCQQLIDHAIEYTNKHKDEIENAEEISIDVIINTFDIIKGQVKIIMDEMELAFKNLSVTLPNPILNFDETMERRVRDFLIIKFLINEIDKIV